MEEQDMKLSGKRVVVLVKVALLVGVMAAAVTIMMYIVPISRSKQTQAQEGFPDPRIDYIHLNGSLASSVIITPGDSVIIEVQETISTSAGYWSGIYISFPEFDSHEDVAYVDLVNLSSSSGDVNLRYIENLPGDPNGLIRYACDSGYCDVAQQLRVGGYALSVLEPGEKISLEVRVTPPTQGIYQIYVRGVVADAVSGDSYYLDPTGGAYKDQQCQYVYRRTVEVGPYSNAVYLPALLRDYSPSKPFRGVWTQASGCYSASRCDQRLDYLQAAGATRLYYSVYYKIAYYHSTLMPHRSFDSLAYLVPAAHERGMEVYAAMGSGHMGWPEHPEWNARLNHPNATEDWLDFTLPEARDFVADVAEEIVTNYDVDGIMLDYTRWREKWYRQANLSHVEISLTVQGVYERVKAARPSVLVSACPDADHWYSYYWRGQKWHDWLDSGYIDYVMPMTYEEDSVLSVRLNEWDTTGHFPERIFPLLSVAWFDPERPKTAEEVLQQVEICYDAEVIGLALFDDRYVCGNQELIDALGAGGW